MRTLVIVSCAGDGSLQVLELHADGQLRPLQRLAPGGTLMPMALRPDRRVLYVARRSAPMAVLAFALGSADAPLQPVGEAPLPASMAYLSTDRSGRWLLAASYPQHLLSVSPLGADGVPLAPQQQVAGVPNAHCIRPSSDNAYALVCSLGADELRAYPFDAATGRLDTRDPVVAKLPPGSGPRHVELHPTRDTLYLLNELDGGLHVIEFRAGRFRHRQRLDTLPALRPDPVSCADLRATPGGRLLYTTERTGSLLSGWHIDAASGLLSPIGHWPTQRQPRAIAIDPQGRFLLAAGQLSHRVGVHAIAADGQLTALSETGVGQTPSWIEIVATAA